MLSVEKCRKFIKNDDYTDEQIERIRDSLYQFAEILFEDFIEKGGVKNEKGQIRDQ